MKYFRELFVRNRNLAILGSILLLLAIFLLVWMPYHQQEVLGINALIKPFKFAISLWVFSWTMAWYSPEFEDKRYIASLSNLIIATSIFEQGAITLQAFRGTRSHFNFDTLPELVLFSLMGVMIVWLTVYVALGAGKLRNQSGGLSNPYRLAIYLGIWLFVLSGLIGGCMSVINSHTIGVPMGGPGLPLLNWSTQGGDLRVSHFVSLHGLQWLPFFAYLLERRNLSPVLGKELIKITFFGYLLFSLFTLVQAFFSISLWSV
jgi:hypothetical protein